MYEPKWYNVFTDAVYPQWHLVTDGTLYGLNHDCPARSLVGRMWWRGRCCVYCGDDVPNTLWGMYKLCSWDK